MSEATEGFFIPSLIKTFGFEINAIVVKCFHSIIITVLFKIYYHNNPTGNKKNIISKKCKYT